MLALGLVPVLVARCINPPDCVRTDPEFKIRLAVESKVPPEIFNILFEVTPSEFEVPPFMMNEPFAFTVISPEAVNEPPVVTVSVAPDPDELMLMVVIVTVLL